jgi:hypothetical protein
VSPETSLSTFNDRPVVSAGHGTESLALNGMFNCKLDGKLNATKAASQKLVGISMQHKLQAQQLNAMEYSH